MLLLCLCVYINIYFFLIIYLSQSTHSQARRKTRSIRDTYLVGSVRVSERARVWTRGGRRGGNRGDSSNSVCKYVCALLFVFVPSCSTRSSRSIPRFCHGNFHRIIDRDPIIIPPCCVRIFRSIPEIISNDQTDWESSRTQTVIMYDWKAMFHVYIYILCPTTIVQ